VVVNSHRVACGALGWTFAAFGSPLAGGCFQGDSDPSGGTATQGDGGAGEAGGAGDGAGGLSGGGGQGGQGGDPACGETVSIPITTTGVDKIDLLFVVDNSGSMREEQASLQREFPRLIKVLTTGQRDPKPSFPPAEDLHLGVISTDMGMVGVQGIPGCEGLGDDGIMNNIPGASVAGCQATYPRFLTYVAGVHDPDQTANDLSCIAALGTDGCGFEQQLEATLKALWPSVDVDVDGNVISPTVSSSSATQWASDDSVMVTWKTTASCAATRSRVSRWSRSFW
jgi:hypothetical protein